MDYQVHFKRTPEYDLLEAYSAVRELLGVYFSFYFGWVK